MRYLLCGRRAVLDRGGAAPLGPTLAAAALMLALAGCGGPLWQIPGGRLQGPEAPLTGADLPSEVELIQLETRPQNPYSVNVNAWAIDGFTTLASGGSLSDILYVILALAAMAITVFTIATSTFRRRPLI